MIRFQCEAQRRLGITQLCRRGMARSVLRRQYVCVYMEYSMISAYLNFKRVFFFFLFLSFSFPNLEFVLGTSTKDCTNQNEVKPMGCIKSKK